MLLKKKKYLIILFLGLFACNQSQKRGMEVLVRVGDNELTREELKLSMPKGLSTTDSTVFSDNYIQRWIIKELFYQEALKNVSDLNQINEMAEQYKQQLITYQYQRLLIDQRLEKEISEDQLLTLYKENASNLILTTPLIKGIFLKIPRNAPRLNDVKQWYKTNKEKSIAKIEEYTVKNAVIYEYFYNRWIQLTEVMENIPGISPERENDFVKQNRNFEFEDKDFIYLLHIEDFALAGEVQPFEYAEPILREMLINQRKEEFLDQVENQLLKNAEKKKKIDYIQWEPLSEKNKK